MWSVKIEATKSYKNWIGEGLGLHLGGVWIGLGPPLGAFGRRLAVFWPFKIELLSGIGPKWAPRGLLEGFGIHLGMDLGGFGEDLGGC